jgi:hypothetical protein
MQRQKDAHCGKKLGHNNDPLNVMEASARPRLWRIPQHCINLSTPNRPDFAFDQGAMQWRRHSGIAQSLRCDKVFAPEAF